MNTRRTDNRPRVELQPPDDPQASIVPTSQRRIIPVGNAKTIVVHPRIPTPYKAMMWFSFGFNIVLLLLLLIGGMMALNLYNDAKNQIAAVRDQLNMNTPIGQRLETIGDDPVALLESDPRPAVDLARAQLDQVMTSIEGLQGAHIRTNIPIDHQQPINFEVPVNQQTSVRTTAPVPLVAPARFTLPGGGGQINGSVALSLPAGMELPINLSMTIPISQTLPVQLNVPVDIAMQDTELADDFQQLHDLVEPAAQLVKAR